VPDDAATRVRRFDDGEGDPNCPLCHGQGYAVTPTLGHEPSTHCVPCHGCRAHQERNRRQRTMSAIRPRVERYTVTRPDLTFETFNVANVHPTVRVAFHAAREFAASPQGWLVLHGNVGTGKTHLASAIANANPDAMALGLIVPVLLDLLRSGYETGDYADLLDLCRTVELLILDDLGTERYTQWGYETLFKIINHRYNQAMPTVFCFNGQIDDLDPRIASRLYDGDLARDLPMWGSDYRRRKRGNRQKD